MIFLGRRSVSLKFFRPCSSCGHFILVTKQSSTCLHQSRRISPSPQSILSFWMQILWFLSLALILSCRGWSIRHCISSWAFSGWINSRNSWQVSSWSLWPSGWQCWPYIWFTTRKSFARWHGGWFCFSRCWIVVCLALFSLFPGLCDFRQISGFIWVDQIHSGWFFLLLSLGCKDGGASQTPIWIALNWK